MAAAQGISLELEQVYPIILLAAALGAASFVLKDWADYLRALTALQLFCFFSVFFVLGMNVTATTARPLADDWLWRLDGGLAASIHHRVNDIPWLSQLLFYAYQSSLPQTVLTIFFLVFTKRFVQLSTFFERFMICALITLVGFYWFPAVGTLAKGLSSYPELEVVRAEFFRLRGGVKSVSVVGAQGMVTFPSFHTIWAILLISVYYRSRLFIPVLILNVLVIVSTVTSGMHYAVDVLAGFAVCAVVFAGCPQTASAGDSPERMLRGLRSRVGLGEPGRAVG
jgi:membrane-associated phospholipid phosphatase